MMVMVYHLPYPSDDKNLVCYVGFSELFFYQSIEEVYGIFGIPNRFLIWPFLYFFNTLLGHLYILFFVQDVVYIGTQFSSL